MAALPYQPPTAVSKAMPALNTSTAILSAAAISREFGVMDHHMCEVEVCRVLVERAEGVIVAADASKSPPRA